MRTARRPSRLLPGVALALLAAVAIGGCGAVAHRGGPPVESGQPEQGATLDRDDIDMLAGDIVKNLDASSFWRHAVREEAKRPVVAIWPIQNATGRKMHDELRALSSALETVLVRNDGVFVVDRSQQERTADLMGIQHAAAIDPATAQKLGRQLGARYFLAGRLTSQERNPDDARRVEYALRLQVIEVETGIVKFERETTRSKTIDD